MLMSSGGLPRRPSRTFTTCRRGSGVTVGQESGPAKVRQVRSHRGEGEGAEVRTTKLLASTLELHPGRSPPGSANRGRGGRSLSIGLKLGVQDNPNPNGALTRTYLCKVGLHQGRVTWKGLPQLRRQVLHVLKTRSRDEVR